MRPALLQKLDTMLDRYEELNALLSDPAVIQNVNQYREFSKENSSLQNTVACYRQYKQVCSDIEQAKNMLKDPDPDMRALAEEELRTKEQELENLEQQLQILLLPVDPNDHKNVYLEIRAAAGGDEAAIFAGDLFRMYSKFAERNRWQVEIINANAGDHGGFKEIIAKISGHNVYAKLKFESGAHRVQRVPETEAQGRVHTSTVTVAVLPEADEIEEITINPADLRIDTYRASGAGGQHVNKTDSAVRIVHIPTGTVVECQEERSQHKNRAKALSLLQARLLDAEQSKQRQQRAATRKLLVGTGDRSERIRTYNFPQGRITDHRINLTLYKLTDVMEGDLQLVIEPLLTEYQSELLSEVNE